MKNLSARYRLQLVDRGLLGCEGVDECLPCIYKKKSGTLKRKQVCNTNLTMILMLYFPHLYHSFITMLVFFFFEKTVEVLTKYYLLEHTMVCTLNWDAGDYTNQSN